MLGIQSHENLAVWQVFETLSERHHLANLLELAGAGWARGGLLSIVFWGFSDWPFFPRRFSLWFLFVACFWFGSIRFFLLNLYVLLSMVFWFAQTCYGLLAVDDVPKATEDNDECEMHISSCVPCSPLRGATIDSQEDFLGAREEFCVSFFKRAKE